MTAMAIICVDDEISVLQSLERELQTAFGDSYVYELAESATEALEIIEELEGSNIKLRIIISDWLMPGIKGDELLNKVHQRYPQVVKILLTGQADQEVINQTKIRVNLYECLAKPWSSQSFINTVRAALGQDSIF